MGVEATIKHDAFPRQGVMFNDIVEIMFHYDTKNKVLGKIIRSDAEEPGKEVIQLIDGRVVLATECQVGLLSKDEQRSANEEFTQGLLLHITNSELVDHIYLASRGWRSKLTNNDVSIYEATKVSSNKRYKLTLSKMSSTLMIFTKGDDGNADLLGKEDLKTRKELDLFLDKYYT